MWYDRRKDEIGFGGVGRGRGEGGRVVWSIKANSYISNHQIITNELSAVYMLQHSYGGVHIGSNNTDLIWGMKIDNFTAAKILKI